MAQGAAAYVRYNGPLEVATLQNHGHFMRGESKLVDYLTAASLRDQSAKDEGWEVSDEPFESSEERASEQSEAPRRRGRAQSDE